MNDYPRLIEHAFPLRQASMDSAHEKVVRHGHISTLHLWPARRPLAAARAVILATLLPDPGTPEGRKKLCEKIGGKLREVKHKEGRVKPVTEGGILRWKREVENKAILDWFREELRRVNGGVAPKVLDPFSGGGAIPLEAMRLGCDVTAADLNPVSWFILKCTLEYPQMFAGEKRPLPEFVRRDREFMEAFLTEVHGFKGARLAKALDALGHGRSGEFVQDEVDLGELTEVQGVPFEADLAWHVRAWGRRVFAGARRQLACLYPTYADWQPLKPGQAYEAEPMRIIDETTGAAKPRVYRNAVLLAVPSKDGLDVVRSRIADLLAWEQVESELKEQAKSGSVDAQRMQRLTVELEKAKKLVPDAIRQAWCMIVTVSEANDVQAFKLNITDDPLFTTLKADPRSRLHETKITAESLLPDGPYDLWKKGETLRRVKDLAGAFAQLPHLPKMLNASAIVDTLVDGCVSGDFVLQLKRPDRSMRTWWRTQPDEEALKDPDMEVVLSTAAAFAEIPGALLRKGTLPGLWESKPELALAEFKGYFAGGKVVQVDRGGYTEGQQVPKASAEVVTGAVEKAVLDGDLWLVSGPTSLFKEAIPAGVLTDTSLLLPPPEPIVAAAILQGNIPAAWKDGKGNVAGILAQLSAQRGKPVPWYQVQQAVDGALRARLVEWDAESAAWPCDPSAAAKVVLKAVGGTWGGGAAGSSGEINDKGVTYRAYLQPNEIQDFADVVGEMMGLQVKHDIKIRFSLAVEVTADTQLKPEATAEVRKALDGVSDAFH